jgi:hypothetical protein
MANCLIDIGPYERLERASPGLLLSRRVSGETLVVGKRNAEFGQIQKLSGCWRKWGGVVSASDNCFPVWASAFVHPLVGNFGSAGQIIFFGHSELRFQQVPRTSLKIGKGLADRLVTAASDYWPAADMFEKT